MQQLEKFVNQLQNLEIKQFPAQNPSQNILDFQKGLINLNVIEDFSGKPKIQFQDFQVSKSNETFYKGYKGSLYPQNMHNNLNDMNESEINQQIEQQIRLHDMNNYNQTLLVNENVYTKFCNSLINESLNNIYSDSLKLKQKNCFSTSFEFSLQDASLSLTKQSLIDYQFKEYRFETQKIIRKQRQQSNKTERMNQEKLQTFEELQQELLSYSQDTSSKIINNKDSIIKKSLKEKIQQNFRLQDILSLRSNNQSNNVNEAYQEENNAFLPKYLKNLISESISNLEVSMQNQKQQQSKKLQEQQQQSERSQQQQQQTQESNNTSSLFKQIRLNPNNPLNIQNQKSEEEEVKNTVNQNNNNSNPKCKTSSQWAEEDQSDVYSFYDMLPKDKMAIQFPFELDVFQKRALLRLEKRQSVLVCAHTSAGKTVVAEYAIALAMKHKKRIVYTSPIKALSNEKYSKFNQKFGSKDVGILTGDTNINDHASCLIMTTEILRNMLYRGHDMIRDIEWVVFDEVHYLNDEQRGVVWEETIILLPEHVGIIMLSATVPNYMDFADWVGSTKKRKIYVQTTLHRPVPLEHSIYFNSKFYVFYQSQQQQFYDEPFDQIRNEAIAAQKQQQLKREQLQKELQEKSEQIKQEKRSKIRRKLLNQDYVPKNNQQDDKFGNQDEIRQLLELIEHCRKDAKLPCVFFIFSKNKIMELSKGIVNKNQFQLLSKKEQSHVRRYFDQVMHNLKPEDQNIPQLMNLREMLQRGLAIHHGDLLPVAKEMVEILFSKGLVRVLLATETFAMGINVPAKTVVFYSLRKNDGESFRELNSSEYTQMSGRAGRRGIDEKGHVIVFIRQLEHLPHKKQMSKMVEQQGVLLLSKFRLSYKSVLSRLNTESDLSLADIMKSSFSVCQKNQQQLEKRFRNEQQQQQKPYQSNDNTIMTIRNMKKLLGEYDQMLYFNCPYKNNNKYMELNIQQLMNGNQVQDLAPIEEYCSLTEQIRRSCSRYLLENEGKALKKVKLPKLVAVLGFNNVIELGILLNFEVEQDFPFEVLLTFVQQQDKSKNQQQYGKKNNNSSKVENKQSAKKIDLDYNKYNNLNQQYSSQQYQQQNSRKMYDIQFLQATEILEIFADEFQISGNQRGYKNQRNSTHHQQQQYINYGEDELCKAADFLNNEKQYFKESDLLNKVQQDQQENQQQQQYYMPLILNQQLYKNKKTLVEQFILQQDCHTCQKRDEHLDQWQIRLRLKKQLYEEQKKLNTNQLLLQDKLERMIQLLQHYKYIDNDSLPLLKASVAKQFDDSMPIVLSELLLENVLKDISYQELAALFSGFVCQYTFKSRRNFGNNNNHNNNNQREEEQPFDLQKDVFEQEEYSDNFKDAIRSALKIYDTFEELEFRLKIADDQIKNSNEQQLNFTLIKVIYLWASGLDFVDVCKFTTAQEGVIIRVILRLDNLLKNVKNAAKIIGNQTLFDLAEQSRKAISRDIVFADSLYLQKTKCSIEEEEQD